jgi:hypothetical protein
LSVNKLNSEREMKTVAGICSRFGLHVFLGLVALTVAAEASAGCGGAAQGPGAAKLPDAAKFVSAVYRGDRPTGSLLKAQYAGEYDPGMVGLWQFTFTGYPAPAGVVSGWGTQAWHSDGTEITFSGDQNPATGDVCQGVWRQIGKDTYTLNHIAMGWLPSPSGGTSFGLRVHLHFVITLNPAGTEFTGTFTETGYCEDGATLPPGPPFVSDADCATPNPLFEYNPNERTSASNPNNIAFPTGIGKVTATRVIPD